ncbi:hypothetical protein [Amycolatopsis circi]|uniref:hypothetical protein n=1 Tax=Amycolatopsis circi TaxID=871959 RepID=UPI001FC93E6D|nr:hypothetical protein [Amycolatopsis circi]
MAEDHEGPVGDLAELPLLVTSDSTLADALDALAQAPGTGLPALSALEPATARG